MKQLTALEIIDETVEFYSADVSRRALDDNANCLYQAPSLNKCAIGRCMTAKALAINKNVACTVDFLVPNIDSLVLKKYRGHSINFWTRLQGFHDFTSYWNKKGLTYKGKKRVIELKALCMPKNDHYVEN